jgi:WhiB family transcriptional regulator, redox-sensing transcriptional regulator
MGVTLRLLKERGECKDEPWELFYPRYDSPSSTAAAIAICDRCPVKPECLEWALQHDEEGVWGGTSEATRRSLKRPRTRTKCITCGSPNVISDVAEKNEFCTDCGLSWPV